MCNPLKGKFDEWREWLLGDDVHSIANQIRTMIWDSGVFQSINEARGYAPTDDDGQIQLNAMVHCFVNKCFFETQAMAIRRLLDKEAGPGRRSVTSLYRLLEDMERHADMLTRGAIVDALGLPYDYENRRQELDRAWDGSFMIAGEDWADCDSSEHVHKGVDFLAGADASARKRADTVQIGIFRWLKTRLEKSRTIHQFVNKFLAHAASIQSRAAVRIEETDVTLGQIIEAHKTICQVAEFVGQKMFLGSLGNPLPTPQLDQFEHFEKSWATGEDLARLREWWNGYAKSTNQWIQWDWRSEYAAHKSGGEHEEKR